MGKTQVNNTLGKIKVHQRLEEVEEKSQYVGEINRF
jgi:hypothetical protein